MFGLLGYIFHLPFGSWLTVLRFMFCVCLQNSIIKKTFFLCKFLWQSSLCTLSKTYMISCSAWLSVSVLFPAHVPLPGSSLTDMSKHICLPVVWLWWHGCLPKETRSWKSHLPQWHAMLAGCDPESYQSSFSWMAQGHKFMFCGHYCEANLSLWCLCPPPLHSCD